jgi:two-component system, OmpR family, KDP operon response regulator KdpE
MSEAKLLAVTATSRTPSVVDRLSNHGFGVLHASIGEGVRRVMKDRPDVVLLIADGEVAPQLCEALSALGGPPLMIAGAHLTASVMADCLTHGADMVVKLPVPEDELSARLQALARRTIDNTEGVLRIETADGLLILDRGAHTVTRRGAQVDLTPTEFRLLWVLAEVPGRLLTYRELLERVWSQDYIDDVQYVRLYINYLRNKLEKNPKQPKLITNQWGVGYRLTATDSGNEFSAARSSSA